MPDPAAFRPIMTGPEALKGARILVVEDEMMAAMMLEIVLGDAGCVVVGPAASVGKGITLAESEPLDAAILDVNLGGEFVFPVADILSARGVPFVFVTGYGMNGVDRKRYARIRVVQKPYDDAALLSLIAGEIAARRRSWDRPT
jgi:CheY-like chemotaxis protein